MYKKDKRLEELQKAFGKERIRQNEPMSLHTTIKIGGPAEFYFSAEEIKDLVKAVKIAIRMKMSFFILGGGSNILVSDNGISGLVIKNNCRKISVNRLNGRFKNKKIDVGEALVLAESGAIFNQLVRFTIEEGLEGLEYQLGLPGAVGGAVFMNSNFPKTKSFVGDCVYKATILTKEGEIKEVDKSYFKFAYDKSILQETGEILLSVLFKLKPADKKMLWKRGTEALSHRDFTQPKGPSAGCFFQNISISQAVKVSSSDMITSAGYFIDKAGLKGKKIGGAMISDKHANFIMNTGNAKASDIIVLTNLVKEEVFKKFGIKLALEVRTIGFNNNYGEISC